MAFRIEEKMKLPLVLAAVSFFLKQDAISAIIVFAVAYTIELFIKDVSFHRALVYAFLVTVSGVAALTQFSGILSSLIALNVSIYSFVYHAISYLILKWLVENVWK